MFVRLSFFAPALLLLPSFVTCVADSCVAQDADVPEFYFFYDETGTVDSQTAGALKAAVESGFRIREIAANRFPNLAKRFQVRRLPSLLLLRKSRLEGRHEGRFVFSRFREMLARARENRVARQERVREMLVGNGRINRSDAPQSVPPIAPRYIQTSATLANANLTSARLIPKPLDRNGRFAVAHHPSGGEKTAFDATVRIRVIDPSGTSHGTGTIIHSTGNDALVLTCGHIFRESRGQGRIEADIAFSTEMKTVSGRLITFDSNAHDIALLTIRTPFQVKPAKIARQSFQGSLNQGVFTVGCDKGNQPTIRRSHFKRAASYDGAEKYDVYGRPIDGRSGGGLFNEQGELIGVCNAAAVHVDEGIYSGLKTIYRQLSISHLSHLFQEDYWKESYEEKADSRLASSNSSSDSSVRFQELPLNPALQFRAPVGGNRNVADNSTGMTRVSQTPTAMPSSRFNLADEDNQLSARQSPRIPSFKMADKL